MSIVCCHWLRSCQLRFVRNATVANRNRQQECACARQRYSEQMFNLLWTKRMPIHSWHCVCAIWSKCVRLASNRNEIITSECDERLTFWWWRTRGTWTTDGVVWIEIKCKWCICKSIRESNLPRDRIFFMFRLIAVLQFHRRYLNWYSHSRNPMLMPRAISSISDVSVLQMSCNLPRKRRGFLHIKCGSSNKLVPSALWKKTKGNGEFRSCEMSNEWCIQNF